MAQSVVARDRRAGRGPARPLRHGVLQCRRMEAAWEAATASGDASWLAVGWLPAGCIPGGFNPVGREVSPSTGERGRPPGGSKNGNTHEFACTPHQFALVSTIRLIDRRPVSMEYYHRGMTGGRTGTGRRRRRHESPSRVMVAASTPKSQAWLRQNSVTTSTKIKNAGLLQSQKFLLIFTDVRMLISFPQREREKSKSHGKHKANTMVYWVRRRMKGLGY